MSMHKTVVALIASVLALQGCTSFARSRMGQVVVKDAGNGVPCFAIEDTQATRSGEPILRAMTVYATSSAAAGKVWSYLVEPKMEGIPITPDACATYGQNPPAVRVLQPATALSTGVIYAVEMNAQTVDRSDPTRMYAAEFCLIKQADNSRRVHQVQWDQQASKWRRDVCTPQ